MRQIYALALAAVISFSSGALITAKHYEDEIAARELKAAVARAEQGRVAYEKLIAAQNGLDAWRASAESMSAELDRVREQSRRRAVRESAYACSVERAAVAKCEGLLERSADAVARCSDLLQRDAAIHDALAESMK